MKWTSVWIAALLFWPAAALAQQNVGSLFFYNSLNDAAAIAHLDGPGPLDVTDVSSPSGWFPTGPRVIKLVNTSNGFLLYNGATGLARVVRLEHAGSPMFPSWGLATSEFWDIIVGSGQFLFFYKTDGAGLIGHIGVDGRFVATQSFAAGTLSVWTHIVATDNNLVFYNRDTGLMTVGHIDVDGRYVQQSSVWVLPNCLIVAGAGRYVLCHHYSAGYVEVIAINRAGVAQPTDLLEAGGQFTDIVRQGEHVIFYSSVYGGTQVAYIDDSGHLVMTHATTVIAGVDPHFAPANIVVSTGTAVLFGHFPSGFVVTGRVTRDGQFQETGRLVLEPFTDIAATAR